MNKLFQKIVISITALALAINLSPLAAVADQYDDFVNSGQLHNLLSDGNFVDVNSLTVQQIQDFLNSNNSWIKDFVDNSDAGHGRSTAQIIWDAAHGKYEASGSYNGINISELTGTVSPKVIMVYLQKEQSLISRTTYNEWAMTASMGYFCYSGVSGDGNNNGCKDIYEGFTKQIENGAWQLRYNYERACGTGFSDYQVGQTIHTSDGGGGYNVNLTNRATSAAYRYTPYVFYSAYNVWNLFNNVYFSGSAPPPPPPDSSSNDTAAYIRTTYTDSVTISGTKNTDHKAYFGNTLIADTGITTWQVIYNLQIGDNSSAVIYKDAGDIEVARKTISVARRKRADANGDSTVNIADLSLLGDTWGQSVTTSTGADFNGDGVVNIADLSILGDNWGQ